MSIHMSILCILQAGFNAGDGMRYRLLPGSQTEAVRNLSFTSNVDTPGLWIFRVDGDSIISGGTYIAKCVKMYVGCLQVCCEYILVEHLYVLSMT